MSAIVIADKVYIPAWVNDLNSFRRWARSDAFPQRGWFSYLQGEVWVDLNMEQLFTHNQVKTRFTVVVGGLVDSEQLGYFFSDRALLSNESVELSTEPDGLFVSWEALKDHRIRLVESAEIGFVELEGTPDMVLEIISPSSVRKDTVVLKDLYWKARVPEFWLVDARGTAPRFDLLRHTDKGYVATLAVDGFIPSLVFGRSFQLTQQIDALRNPRYVLEFRK